MAAAEHPIYVVVCTRGGGPECLDPIVLETEMEHATLQAAKARAARFDGKPSRPLQIGGPARIARLVFEDHPAFAETATRKARSTRCPHGVSELNRCERCD